MPSQPYCQSQYEDPDHPRMNEQLVEQMHHSGQHRFTPDPECRRCRKAGERLARRAQRDVNGRVLEAIVRLMVGHVDLDAVVVKGPNGRLFTVHFDDGRTDYRVSEAVGPNLERQVDRHRFVAAADVVDFVKNPPARAEDEGVSR